tara:strand:- start:249 stop:494 length:246 start_codon:yes stop_codon:yes gene_type:complete
MSAIALRKQLHDFIDQCPEEELEELLEVLCGQERQTSGLDDLEVLEEMNRRWEAYKNGTEPVHSWNDVKTGIDEILAKKRS